MHLHDAPNSGLLSVKKTSSYRDAKDLNEKMLAFNGLNNIVLIATRVLLDKSGADSTTVKFVELPLSTITSAVEADRMPRKAASSKAGFPAREMISIAAL